MDTFYFKLIMDKLIPVIWIVFVEYILVLIAVMLDLWSGVRKARKTGKIRTSYGYRRTVDKLARYYNLLFLMTIIDVMQISGIWYANVCYGHRWPLIPALTMFGAIGFGIIELKSIYEKAEDKEIHRITEMTGQVITNRRDVEAVAQIVLSYIKNKEDEKSGTD